MQALVGTVRGELQAQMEADHQEAQRQKEMIRGGMKQITNDVQLLTKQLNDTKLVKKRMLSEVETGVKGEIHKNIDATIARIDILSE